MECFNLRLVIYLNDRYGSHCDLGKAVKLNE